eukprot:10517131-Prorocentrum_lima.AAC.1
MNLDCKSEVRMGRTATLYFIPVTPTTADPKPNLPCIARVWVDFVLDLENAFCCETSRHSRRSTPP